MKLKSAIGALFALFLACQQALGAATLLPPGESCFQATVGINGMVGTLGTLAGGSSGTAGTYAGVALTGGSGSGATANVTVAGGAVTAVTIINPGTAYVTGDVLSAVSATIGNVSGFSVPVASTSINSSLAGGKVYFYRPNSGGQFKTTWFNADASVNHQNTNPVQLDQNGCAIIYGTGSYEQVVQDSLGNTIWDQVTTDTSANNSTFWAGVSGGTPNAITVTDPGFNGTDGSIINFTALSTNTGPATLNASGFGAIAILKDTTGGPVSLVGGEIVQTNPISVIFRSSDAAFHLLTTAIPSASGATAPLCGAVGLVIVNSTGTPNSIINMTADQAVMQTPNGLVINRSNVSLLTINITTGQTTAAANGMDGEVPGVSQWLNVYMIDNGSAPASLVSTSATAPTMPSGYNYRCRLGAMRVDGSGNLQKSKQLGSRAQWTQSGYATIATGGNGGVNTQTSLASYVPPTATVLFGALNFTGSATGLITLGPNASNNIASYGTLTANISGIFDFSMTLESQNMWYSSTTSGSSIFATGWQDKVNAN